MLLRGYVPNNFSLRVVDPILKDNFGDLSSVDNYGLVILSPTIAKIFESVLLIKYGDYLYSVLYVFFNLDFFCKAASNVGPYGLFWQPALYFIHRYYIFVY